MDLQTFVKLFQHTYSERFNKVVIARSEATRLRAEALWRASVAIS